MRHSYREIAPGMGVAVAERTILRRKTDGELENWGDVAHRVALGNSSLIKNNEDHRQEEYKLLYKHIANATTVMSGRHLQHGDENQINRPLEVFTNCATSPTSFMLFYLLLNGSGVGRCYDDDILLVNWDNAPTLRCVISSDHKDFDYSSHESLRDAQHKYGYGENTIWFEIPDSREGWAKALELWETLAFEKIHKDKMLILDFSQVRPKGAPIKGMQNRPSSGPVALINAFHKAASLKGSGLATWKQAMYIDHYFAECVLVGGARRAARMSTKIWSDNTILDFITVKRPIEYNELSAEQILSFRKNNMFPPQPFLWSSNNSVMVDDEFWNLVEGEGTDSLSLHAKKVFKMISESSYSTGTGEPGIINAHKLVQKNEGWTGLNIGDYVASDRYQTNEDTQVYLSKLAKKARRKKYTMITNPCVAGDTVVMTAKGSKQVNDLIGIPFTAIVDGKGYASSGFWSTGTKQIFNVLTKRGYSVRATGNHEVLVQVKRRRKSTGGYYVDQMFRRVDELEPGDKIVLSNNRALATIHDPKLFQQGWMLGLMKGDGGHNPDYEHGSYVRFWDTTVEANMISSAAGFVREQLNADARFKGGSYNIVNKTHTIASKKLCGFANLYLTACDKNITVDLEQAAAPLVAGFLRGFFDADGSVQGTLKKGRSVRLSQSNEKELQIVQRMLAKFGIISSIYLRRNAGERLMPNGHGGHSLYSYKTQYELVVSRDNIHVFEDKIGFSHPEKASKLASFVDDTKREPYAETFTTCVLSVEPDGFEEVFDCSVEDINRFDANSMIVHNCGEITLNVLGAFCVIADVVPYHAETLDEAEEAFRTVTRAMIRVNTMDSIYKKEVDRTNRIGVGITGIHEFAYKFFGYGFYDLIDEEKSKDFWLTLARFNRAVRDEAEKYSKKLGVNIPHTMTTVKPSGTVSKLFMLTEGWHLPSMREYLRWVQFRSDDLLIENYRKAGYPVRELVQYSGTTIVGFPTAPAITTLGMGDKLVTAAEATPADQFKWLMLGEKYWIHGTDENGEPVKDNYGNQISYTLKYKPDLVSLEHFQNMLLKYQSKVRCCSVMPQEDASAYEYQPEEQVSKKRFRDIVAKISAIAEDIGREHIDCATGACPIDFNEGEKA